MAAVTDGASPCPVDSRGNGTRSACPCQPQTVFGVQVFGVRAAKSRTRACSCRCQPNTQHPTPNTQHRTPSEGLTAEVRDATIGLAWGEVPEWSIGAVSKTVELQGSVGSNPTLSVAREACFAHE